MSLGGPTACDCITSPGVKAQFVANNSKSESAPVAAAPVAAAPVAASVPDPGTGDLVNLSA